MSFFYGNGVPLTKVLEKGQIQVNNLYYVVSRCDTFRYNFIDLHCGDYKFGRCAYHC